MDNKKLMCRLLEALPIIANVTNGYASLTDANGRRIRMIDSQGKEVKSYRNVVYDLARDSYDQQKPILGFSQVIEGAKAWAIPFGPYVITCSNIEDIERENRLKDAIVRALPLIAKVAGGEAVVFSNSGKRIASCNPDGTANEEYIGKVSTQAKRAMEINQPLIGESMSISGAMAVRIPITKSFGLGFNNELTAIKSRKLIEEVKKSRHARYYFADIVGGCSEIREVVEWAKRLAAGQSTILIYGETGTGKELFAQAIHNASHRANKPFVALNCGAIPASLIESSLFGYVEGSYTGAKRGGAPGAFEQADGGTIFLDEISEMDINLQTKLLRVLQEREVNRIGETRPVPVDVRVVACTNKDLEKLVVRNLFRSDLYYRLNVVFIKIPSLRERKQDIGALVKFFIQKFNQTLGKCIIGIKDQALDILIKHDWPGNVRELQNAIEHAVNMTDNQESQIEHYHLPKYLLKSQKKIGIASRFGLNDESTTDKSLDEVLFEVEETLLKTMLKKTGNNRREAAKRLGISVTTLWRKLAMHGL